MTDDTKAKLRAVLDLMGMFWDWFDQRQVEKHLVAAATMIATFMVIRWSIGYADLHVDKSGSDLALVIGAINAPMLALQGVVINYYFKARTETSPA